MKRAMTRAVRRAYIEELALARVAMRLATAMEQSAKNQKDIAVALGVTEARVSQIMNGEANLTVKTLARIADAIGQEFDPQFCPAAQEMPQLVKSAQEPLYITETRRVELSKWKPAPPKDASTSSGDVQESDYEGYYAAA